ncbi:MAG: CPC_1213 family protein [Clostridiaceae bacterium]
MRPSDNNKKEDGKFKKVNIKHGLKESVRSAVHPESDKQSEQSRNI